jgi:hypothetical protein
METLYIFVLAHEIKLSHHQVQSSEPGRRKKKRISLLTAMIKQPLAKVLHILFCTVHIILQNRVTHYYCKNSVHSCIQERRKLFQMRSRHATRLHYLQVSKCNFWFNHPKLRHLWLLLVCAHKESHSHEKNFNFGSW